MLTEEIISIFLGNLENTCHQNAQVLDQSGLPVASMAFNNMGIEINVNKNSIIAMLQTNRCERLARYYRMVDVENQDYSGFDEIRAFLRAYPKAEDRCYYTIHQTQSELGYKDENTIVVITHIPSLTMSVNVYDPMEYQLVEANQYINFLPQSTIDAIIDQVKKRVGYHLPTWEYVNNRFNVILNNLLKHELPSIKPHELDKWSKEHRMLDNIVSPKDYRISVSRLTDRDKVAISVLAFKSPLVGSDLVVEVVIVKAEDLIFGFFRKIGSEVWLKVQPNENASIYVYDQLMDALSNSTVHSYSEQDYTYYLRHIGVNTDETS